MAAGDAAAAISWPVVNGATTAANTVATEINTSRDLAAGVYTETRPVARGGTGGTTQAAAATALAVVPKSDVYVSGSIAGKIPRYDGSGRLLGANPVASNQFATKAYVDGAGIAFNGGVVTGDIYLPNATAASSGYVVCYLNGDGRISRGASSSRFKKNIDRQPVPEGFTELVASYLMRQDSDHVTRFGPIVEDMEKRGGAVAALVTHDAEGRPESFDQISFLMACVAELSARVKELEAR